MRTTLTIGFLCALLTLAAGCSSPQGVSVTERQDSVRQMRDKVLSGAYVSNPEIKAKIKNAAGYGVFNNVNINIILISAGDGYGIVRNNKTSKETFMKMGLGGVGFGIGAKDYRSIIIFNTKLSLLNFLASGWEFGGHADAVAKAGEKGAGVGGEGDIKQDVEIYSFTEHGLALQATVTGTKYWKDKELN